jgi:hypothetical protein
LEREMGRNEKGFAFTLSATRRDFRVSVHSLKASMRESVRVFPWARLLTSATKGSGIRAVTFIP